MAKRTAHQRLILERSKTSRGCYLDLEVYIFVKIFEFDRMLQSLYNIVVPFPSNFSSVSSFHIQLPSNLWRFSLKIEQILISPPPQIFYYPPSFEIC
jgi:hypothetical protein